MTSNSILFGKYPTILCLLYESSLQRYDKANERKCKLSVQNILEVFPMNKTADRTVALDKGRVDIYTKTA